MIADVRRAYTPFVEWERSTFQQLSLANIQALNSSARGVYPNIVPVRVNPTLIHRKIWAWVWSVSATWSTDIVLVGRLNGITQFEFLINRWNTGSQTEKFVWNFAQVSTNIGATGEQLFTIVNTTTFGVSPFRLNVALDELYLRVDKITGAAAAFDAGLVVQSQAGI